jgi:sugar lactone lactonase YvrE
MAMKKSKILEILEVPDIPVTSVPDLKFEQAEITSFDFALPTKKAYQGIAPLAVSEDIILNDLQRDFLSGRLARGRTYRQRLAIGRTNEGSMSLRMPFGVALLQDGNIYIIDTLDKEGGTRIQLFDKAGNLIRTVCQFGVEGDLNEVDTPAGFDADIHGNFYIADMGSSYIKKFSPTGKLLLVFGGEGTSTDRLKSPHGLDIDASGNLYIADTENNRILKWDQEGNVLLVLGINDMDEDTGWLMAGAEPGEFDEPLGVAVDSMGNIIAVDTNNHRVQKFSPENELLVIFGEEGEEPGQLHYPDDIQVDDNDNIYTSDLNGARIQKFDSSGNFIYQFLLPIDRGSGCNFAVDDEKNFLIPLRRTPLVVKLEILD